MLYRIVSQELVKVTNTQNKKEQQEVYSSCCSFCLSGCAVKPLVLDVGRMSMLEPKCKKWYSNIECEKCERQVHINSLEASHQ